MLEVCFSKESFHNYQAQATLRGVLSTLFQNAVLRLAACFWRCRQTRLVTGFSTLARGHANPLVCFRCSALVGIVFEWRCSLLRHHRNPPLVRHCFSSDFVLRSAQIQQQICQNSEARGSVGCDAWGFVSVVTKQAVTGRYVASINTRHKYFT